MDEHDAPRVRPVDLRDYADFRRGPATRVRVFASEQLALDLLCIEPGASTGVLHHPDQDVTYTVIGGRSWFVTDDGEVGLDPMGAMLVPADTVHGIDNRLPDPLIVLAAVAPPGAAPEDPVSDAEDAIGGAVHHPPEGPGPVRRAIEALLGTRRPR
jgi:quercetin dioxygenase-like cupin family protein